MAVSLHDNWQAGKTVLECNKYMLDNQLCCDVSFQVGESGKLMGAHKYVLASRSSVFATMFFGSLPETSDVIAVSDIEADVFDILLRYLYYEDDIINHTTVIGTLYAANKYAIANLVNICQSFLDSNITEETVCGILENAWIFNMADLLSKCVSFIMESRARAIKIFESSTFLQCNRECLQIIISSDELPLDEKFIYTSLLRWAKYKCRLMNICIIVSTEIRKMLGLLIYEIRFPLMSQETLRKVEHDNLLSPEEKIQITQLLAGKNVENSVFNTEKRSKPHRVYRVKTDSTNCIWNQSGQIDAISFEVNKPLFLHGLLLYGSCEIPYTYSVELKIISMTNTVLLHIFKKCITESQKIFQIEFDRPYKITPNEMYTIWVNMSGPQSFRGKYSDIVVHGDYTFKFENSHFSSNATDVSTGQIPGLLCRQME